MECALPLGLAWFLHHRSPKKRVRLPSKHHGLSGQGGQQQVNSRDTRQPRGPAAASSASAPPESRSTDSAVSNRELRQLQWMLLCLSVLQLVIRSGLWERLFHLTAVSMVRTAHGLSKRALKALFSPVILCLRPLTRRGRRKPHANAAPATHGLDAAPAPAATPASQQNSPQSGSDMEEPAADVPMQAACPPHIVIISRPQLQSSNGAASAPGPASRPQLPHDSGASTSASRPPAEAPAPRLSLSSWHAGVSGSSLSRQLRQEQQEQEQDGGLLTRQPGGEIQGEAEPGSDDARLDLGSNGEVQSDPEAEAEAEPGAEAEAGAEGPEDARQMSMVTPLGGTDQPPSTAAPPSHDARPFPPSASPLEAAQASPGAATEPCSSSQAAARRAWDGVQPVIHVVTRSRAPPPGWADLEHQKRGRGIEERPVDTLALLPSGRVGVTEGEAAAAASAGALPFLDLPLSVAVEVLRQLDPDSRRLLRGVSRGLYFESSRQLTRLTVRRDNLETLVYMPMHQVFPTLVSLSFVEDAAPAGLAPLSPALLSKLFRESLPQLRCLREVDVTEACLHTSAGLWEELAAGLAGGGRREVMVRLREPTAWWARGATAGLPGDGRDARDHFPPLLDALRTLQRAAPAAAADLQGVTVRRHTATRLPQLTHLTCLRHLTLFGKSSVAVPHGHRLASHLHAFVSTRHLVSLELLSYEDVSDSELAVLSDCTSLRHLYVDSLFIKMAAGPVFPSITSLATARIKFILQPLTTIFPNLTRLRLGVLHSELNKKINSASVSCLAGCSQNLQELVVCPILWKGQWQVLPTLSGMRRLSLVHCRDLSHLREVLVVVGRSPSLQVLELQACSSSVPPWPGVVAVGPAAILGLDLAVGGDAGGLDPEDASGTDTQALGPISELSNLFAGLSGCETLRELVVHDCAPVLVRHLAAAALPALRTLRLQKMGPLMRLPDVQAAVLNLQALNSLHIEDSPSVSAAQAHQLPQSLSRPQLSVNWSSSCWQPSLYTTRGFGLQEEL